MSALATDSFDRGNSANLGANWTPCPGNGGPSDIKILTNEAVSNASGTNSCRYNAATAPDDQYAGGPLGATVTGTSDEGAGGVTRINGASEDKFYLSQSNTVQTRLYRSNGGTSFTQLGSDGASGATGDLMFMWSVGTAHRVEKNGVVIIGPVTDATHTTGQWGLWASLAGTGLSAWEAGDPSQPSVISLPTLGPGTFQRPMAGLF